MSDPSIGPAVVDTGVFGARLTPSGKPLASGYQPLLADRPAVLCFVTALRLEVPLIAHDTIFANVNGLKLLTRLDA